VEQVAQQDAVGLAIRLADDLERRGCLSDPAWRRALTEVPRHLFVPPRGRAQPVHPPEDAYPLDAVARPAEWWSAVYSDTAIITQLDEGATDPGSEAGIPTSSASAPGMVTAFLDLLDVWDHHRVLEIGTGTGFTAALLAHRLGASRVVTIEVDAKVSAQAEASLKAAGYAPTLIVGDGAHGWEEGAPYDRVHVTCGVDTIPYAWVEQIRPGGLIVVPWMPGHGNGCMLSLAKTGDIAVGHFGGGASYMMMRAQRKNLTWHAHHADQSVQRSTRLDPRVLAQSGAGADLALAAHVPGLITRPVSHADTGEFELLLWDEEGSSWAECDYEPDRSEFTLTSHGPRDLWTEAGEAFAWWIRLGSPAADRFGLSVTPTGQDFWLGEPSRRV
jgi:protein-L-isoaspartate O-methyltransferase